MLNVLVYTGECVNTCRYRDQCRYFSCEKLIIYARLMHI